MRMIDVWRKVEAIQLIDWTDAEQLKFLGRDRQGLDQLERQGIINFSLRPGNGVWLVDNRGRERQVTYDFDTPKMTANKVAVLNHHIRRPWGEDAQFNVRNSWRWCQLRFGPLTLREVNKQHHDAMVRTAIELNNFIAPYRSGYHNGDDIIVTSDKDGRIAKVTIGGPGSAGMPGPGPQDRFPNLTKEKSMKNVRFYMDFGPRPRQCCCHSCGDCHSRACVELRQVNAMKGDREKVADLILCTMHSLESAQRKNLSRRINTWVNCTAEEFALFIIQRNDAGLQNNIKNIRPSVVTENWDTKRDYYVPPVSFRLHDSNSFTYEGTRTGRVTEPKPTVNEQTVLFTSPGSIDANPVIQGPDFAISAHVTGYTNRGGELVWRHKKPKKEYDVFFVLKGVAYRKPDYAKVRPKDDGWYFIEKGEKYVCSSPFDTERDVLQYLGQT